MSRFYSHLHTATTILSGYRGEIPFSSALRQFFSAHKKHGSRDRKEIAQLCYSYFRAGHITLGMPVEERILTGLFLCMNLENEFLDDLKPAWKGMAALSTAEKLQLAGIHEPVAALFPYAAECSEGIEADKFAGSFLVQPLLFLRIRPGKEKQVIEKLQDAQISFERPGPESISVPPSTKIETLFEPDRELVIQDLSSQKLGGFLKEAGNKLAAPVRVWDCCAGSGGKAILAHDILGKIELTVSDSRESILHNLRKRFRTAGIQDYRSFTRDLAVTGPFHPKEAGLVIADIPCTGSGTWSRTPEQLHFFEPARIRDYADLQRKIIAHAQGALKPGALFLYSTCSVFRQENEEQVEYIKEKFHLRLLKMELIKGYEEKADTMFAALLEKTS